MSTPERVNLADKNTCNVTHPILRPRRSMPGRNEAAVKGTLEKAFGYQGDNMNLPVADLASALPFYETVLGFQVVSRGAAPHTSAVIGRDQVQMGLVENGGDSSQDGCAFHVKDLASLFAEFKTNGLQKEISEFSTEQHGGVDWKVFYVVAPDGLCYWFGERAALTAIIDGH